MKSFQFKIKPRRKQFIKLLSRLHRLLEDAYWEEHDKNKLTKVKLAEKMGVHKSLITRWFGGTSNMTLETISNLAFELNRDIEINMPRKESYVLRRQAIGNVASISDHPKYTIATSSPKNVREQRWQA